MHYLNFMFGNEETTNLKNNKIEKITVPEAITKNKKLFIQKTNRLITINLWHLARLPGVHPGRRKRCHENINDK